MNFQIDVTSSLPTNSSMPSLPNNSGPETVELLKQLIDVQKEQLSYLKAAAAAHDMVGRWRSFLSRWQQEFPELANSCRKALPNLERSYGHLIRDLTERLAEEEDALDTDFALQEFLDRYGMRVAQLGTILNLVGPLAEAGPAGEAS